MFLLRHNIRYAGQSSWTSAHLRYLARIKMPFPAQQFALQELMNTITEAGERLERFDTQLAREVAGWRWEPAVRALMSLRGVALLNAATLIAELGDLHRFTRPAELMSYLGLGPSEHTTGADRQQGGLTKMGNGYARRALVEAAHHYRVPAPPHAPFAKAPGRPAQSGDRGGLGSATAPAPPLQTTLRPRTQESAGG
jgi:transposase